MQEQPQLHTERLFLRLPEPQDAPDIQRYVSEPEIAAYTHIPHPYPEDGAAQWIRQSEAAWQEGTEANFLVILPETSACIGCAGLIFTPDHRRAEIGYWIAKPYWGRGYVTEASRRVLQYAFEDRKTHKITSGYFAKNAASEQVQRKLGLKIEGILRDQYFRDSAYHDLVVTGLLRSEYFAQVSATP